MTDLVIWIVALLIALALGIVIIQTAQSLVRDVRTGQARFWVGRTAYRRTEPGRYWSIFARKVFSLLVISPLTLLAVWIVVAGAARLFIR